MSKLAIAFVVGVVVAFAAHFAFNSIYSRDPAWPASGLDVAAREYYACGQSGRGCSLRRSDVVGLSGFDPTIEQHAACARDLFLVQAKFNKAGEGAVVFRCRLGRMVGEYDVDLDVQAGRPHAGGTSYAFFPADLAVPVGDAVNRGSGGAWTYIR